MSIKTCNQNYKAYKRLMKYRDSKQSKPIPVLLDKALRDRIEAVSQKMGEPKSTIMRIAMRIGLEGLEKAFEGDPKLSSLIFQSESKSNTAPSVLNDAPEKKKKTG
jgi:hypothetical protein